MSAAPPLHAFAGYGIELEYMIVDRASLAVRPLADRLLRDAAGRVVNELPRGAMGWSNELVLHLLEIKNAAPGADLAALAGAFQAEVREANRQLEALGARLMPSAMHPWMDPRQETRLWPYEHAEIYRAYDRIFRCGEGHGWANLQSMHVNLPFAGDAEFARLHDAVRLVLPILPALAASSPLAEGAPTGWLDFRLEAYRGNARPVPSCVGLVIPERAATSADYRARVLAPIYREIAPLDPEGTLQHEWVNSRGVIPRFDRSALEIRLIDVQECPAADIAIAGAVIAVVRALYRAPPAGDIATGALADILLDCIRDAEAAVLADRRYLAALGFPGQRCTAGELWAHLAEATAAFNPLPHGARSGPIAHILQRGTLARRILRAVGAAPARERLRQVYAELCDCLERGVMFEAEN